MEVKKAGEMKLNVILSLDDNFIDYTKTTMVSLVNNTDQFVNFYLLTNSKDIKEKQFDVIKKVKESNIKLIYVPEKMYTYLMKRKIFKHLSVATYFRHFSAELIPDVHKAVYIDSDTLVVGDLAKLLNEDIGQFEYVRGVEDASSDKKMEIWDITRYINAGVLLMNLDFVHRSKEEFYEKIKFFYDNFGNKTISGDQDMLNFVFKPNYIPFRYNLYHPFFNKQFIPKSCSQDKYYDECKSPVVIHFVGSRKPWVKEVIHPYKSMWESTFNLMKHLDVN